MAAPLALPPAAEVLQRTRSRNAVVIGAALYGLAALTLTASLIGAYTAFRDGVLPWPPEGVRKENYFGTLLLGASIMLMLAAEWMVWAVRQGFRRQTLQAAALAAGLLLAMLNAVAFTVDEAGYGAGTHAYGVLFYAFMVVAGLTQVAALGALGAGLARVGGRQISPAEPQLARAVSIALHVAALTWVMVWSALYAASR
jgi:heme/copper-type cytochrome/quinol oxidase subunit 3